MAEARTLDDIFDQPAAVDWLAQAWRADRLPHAMIFSGPVGVGKGTAARALARLFLCEKPVGVASCGTCESCRVFDAKTHPDYHLVYRELIRFHDKTGKSKGTELSINVLRPELVEPAGRKAVMGRGKVFVIEQAEFMNAAAQNAILKTLEEPLGRTLIVLLTDQAGALLPTIRSRCQMVRFVPLPPQRVLQELRGRGVEEPIASVATELSRGSLGLALKWIEDGVIEPVRELMQTLDALLAGQQTGDLAGWFKTAAEAYAARQLDRDELASKDQANREGLTLYLTLAGEHLRARLAAAQTADDLDAICAAIDALVQAELLLEANVNVGLILQQLSTKLSMKPAALA